MFSMSHLHVYAFILNESYKCSIYIFEASSEHKKCVLYANNDKQTFAHR